MISEEQGRAEHGGISKVKLAIGAASLFLFIVGVKRTYHSGEGESATVADRREARRAARRASPGD